jgi:hypothetical protein
MVPNDPDTLLRRDATAAALTDAGFQTSPKTLATQASRGGGPPYRSWGRWPLYRWGDALAWAHSRLSPPRRNTSEVDTYVPPTAVVPDSQPQPDATERASRECSDRVIGAASARAPALASSSRSSSANRTLPQEMVPVENSEAGGKKRARNLVKNHNL